MANQFGKLHGQLDDLRKLGSEIKEVQIEMQLLASRLMCEVEFCDQTRIDTAKKLDELCQKLAVVTGY